MGSFPTPGQPGSNFYPAVPWPFVTDDSVAISNEIKSIPCDANLSQVAAYTATADQERLAVQAMKTAK